MNTKIARCIPAILLTAATLCSASVYAADVKVIGTWESGTTHATETGSNRGLLFFAHVEDGSADQWVTGVTYGGQAMTKVTEKIHAAGTRSYVAAFILKESGIAAATTGNFSVTWHHAPGSGRAPAYSSVFLENVNQTTATGATGTAGGATAIISTAALSSTQGDMVFVAATQGSTGTYNVLNYFTEGIEVSPGSADGVAGRIASPGGNITPSVQHSAAYRQAALGFVVKSTGATTVTNSQLITAVEQAVEFYAEQHGVAGLNVALARDGDIIWESGYGYSDLASQTAYTSSTVMRSGSMGKAVTAVAVMQLVDDGEFATSSLVNDYLANVDVTNPKDPWGPPGPTPITISYLLSHQSGLLTNVASPNVTAPSVTLESHLLSQLSLSAWPPYNSSYLSPIWYYFADGTFSYSNTGYAVLGQLVQENNSAGSTFSQYVKDNIFDPLGMTSSVYPAVQNSASVPSTIWNAQSTGYAQFGQIYIPTVPLHLHDYPAGNIMSTPADMVRVAMAMANGGTSPENSNQILTSTSVNAMLTPIVETNPPTFYGRGWYLNDYGTNNYAFGHSGAHMYGHNNDFRAYPNQGIAICVATNTFNMVPERTPLPQTIAAYARSFLQGTPPDISATLDSYSWVQPGAGSTNPSDWNWKTSYAIGLMLAERIKGSLGVTGTITTTMVDNMVNGVVERLNTTTGATTKWSAAGFRAGFADMMAISPMTRTAVLNYVNGTGMDITAAELETIYYEIGGDDFDNNAFGKIH